MAIDLLGETLDIHCGGIDLIFPHHEDEIAQSEAATGKTFSRFWCHGAFLLTDGAKMAKRLGNVTTVQGMREAEISAAAVRHFVFNTHYRKELNLSEEALEASINAVRRVGDFAERLASGDGRNAGAGGGGGRRRWREVEAALFDDLNAPNALAGCSRSSRGRTPSSTGRATMRSAWSGRGRRSRGSTACWTSCRTVTVDDPELAAWVEERLAARQGGARAAGFRGGGPDSRRADGAGDRDRGHAGRDEVEASASSDVRRRWCSASDGFEVAYATE